MVAVAEDGSAVVPLLGGHRGANALARRSRERWACRRRSPPPATSASASPSTSRRRAGRWPIPATPRASWRGCWKVRRRGSPSRSGDAAWLRSAFGRLGGSGGARAAGHRSRGRRHADPPGLSPAGAGARASAASGARRRRLFGRWSTRRCAERGLARASVACVVSLDLKADEPAVHALGLPARFFPAARLVEETERLSTRSELVFRETGCWGVAEGAALAAVGPAGSLLVPKQKGQRVTCAVAIAPDDLDPCRDRPAAGRLAVVGLGPGGPAWRTAEAERLLAEAEDWSATASIST